MSLHLVINPAALVFVSVFDQSMFKDIWKLTWSLTFKIILISGNFALEYKYVSDAKKTGDLHYIMENICHDLYRQEAVIFRSSQKLYNWCPEWQPKFDHGSSQQHHWPPTLQHQLSSLHYSLYTNDLTDPSVKNIIFLFIHPTKDFTFGMTRESEVFKVFTSWVISQLYPRHHVRILSHCVFLFIVIKEWEDIMQL